MLLHVDVQTGFLSKGSTAQLALVGFLPGVNTLMSLEVVLAGEVLATHLALVRGLPQVPLGVHDPLMPLEELLGAVLTLESLPTDVLELPVPEHSVLGRIRLPTEVADVGVGSWA